MPDVFISYCRADGDFAEVLRRRLAEGGFTTWMDQEEILAGEEWSREIDDAIRQSTALIVILTPASHASAYVTFEWSFALGSGVTVIPVLLAATPVHPRLGTLHHLDFTRREARPWEELLGVIRSVVEARPVQAIRVSRSAPPIVKDAVAALDQVGPETVGAAVRRLAQIDLPEAEAALVEALRHPVADVRIEAAWHRARRGDVRAVPGLIEGNRRRGWHHEFARRIQEIGEPAIPALREALLDSDAGMRRDVVWALRAIGGREVVGDLMGRLTDADAEVRLEAAEALKALGTPESMAAVRGAVSGFVRDLREAPRSVQWRVAEFLHGLNDAEATTAANRWQEDNASMGGAKEGVGSKEG